MFFRLYETTTVFPAVGEYALTHNRTTAVRSYRPSDGVRRFKIWWRNKAQFPSIEFKTLPEFVDVLSTSDVESEESDADSEESDAESEESSDAQSVEEFE